MVSSLRIRVVVSVICSVVLAGGCGGNATNQNVTTGTDSGRLTAESKTGKDEHNAESLSSNDAQQLIEAGRALEYGNIHKAEALLKTIEKRGDEYQYLESLIMKKSEKWDALIAVLQKSTFKYAELQQRADEMRLDALIQAEQWAAAVSFGEKLLKQGKALTNGERRDISETMGDCFWKMKDVSKAIAMYETARRWSGPSRQESLDMKMGRLQLEAGMKKEAQSILASLAMSARKGRNMTTAYDLLAQHGVLPKWTKSDQTARLNALIQKKRWDAALALADNLSKSARGAVAKELRWQKANILFDRRNHYTEAIGALELVMKDGKPYAEQAEFKRARALSRIDKDDDAIAAYNHFAQKTSKPAMAASARFLAARLSFYLGKHGDALKGMEKVLRDNEQHKNALINADKRRDAHFIAGMSAFLIAKYDEAQKHFKMASKGSNSEMAIARNTYWSAAAAFASNAEIGKVKLEQICEDDPTGWYALMAGRRIQNAGMKSNVCLLLPIEVCKNDDCKLKDEAASMGSGTIELVEVLEQTSANGALFARMGLYREAADYLREVEKRGSHQLSDQLWIQLYNYLDAPQYAIRRASIGFNWKEREAAMWRAVAAYPQPYKTLVGEQTQRHDLPSSLIFSIARKESLFDPFAISYVGAMGMMQMMPATYEANCKRAGLAPLEPGQLPDPYDSVVAGGFELAYLLDKYEGNLPLAIMGYNAGTKGVDRWLERSGDFDMDVFVEKAGFAQTRNYVRRVYQNMVRYRMLYGPALPMLQQRPKKMTPRGES